MQQQKQFSLQTPSINFQAPRQNATQRPPSSTIAAVTGKTQHILDQLNSFVVSTHTQQENSEKLQQKYAKQQHVLGEQRNQVQELRSERAKITEQLRLQEASVGEVEVQAATYKSQFQALQKMLLNSKARLEAGDTRFSAMSDWKDGVDNRLAAIHAKVEEAVSSYRRRMDEVSTEKALLADQNKSLKQDVADTLRCQADTETQVRALKAERENSGEEIARLKEHVASLEGRIKELEKNLQHARVNEENTKTELALRRKLFDEAKDEAKAISATVERQRKEWEADLKRHRLAAFEDKAKVAEEHHAYKSATEQKLQALKHESELSDAVSKEKIAHLQQTHQVQLKQIEQFTVKVDTLVREADVCARDLARVETTHSSYEAKVSEQCEHLESFLAKLSEDLLTAQDAAVSQRSEWTTKVQFYEQRLTANEASTEASVGQLQTLESQVKEVVEQLGAQKDMTSKFMLEAQEQAAMVAEKDQKLQQAEKEWSEKLKENMFQSQAYFSKAQIELKAEHDKQVEEMKTRHDELSKLLAARDEELAAAKQSLQESRTETSVQTASREQAEKVLMAKVENLQNELTAIVSAKSAKQSPPQPSNKESRGLVPSAATPSSTQLRHKWFPDDYHDGEISSTPASFRTPKGVLSKPNGTPRVEAAHDNSDLSLPKKGSSSSSKIRAVPTFSLPAAVESDGPTQGPVEKGKHNKKDDMASPRPPGALAGTIRTPSRSEDVSSLSQSFSQDPGAEKTVKKRKRSTIDGPPRSSQSSKRVEGHHVPRPFGGNPSGTGNIGKSQVSKVPLRYGTTPVSLPPASASSKSARRGRKGAKASPKLSPADSEMSIDLFSQGAC